MRSRQMITGVGGKGPRTPEVVVNLVNSKSV